jgi:2-hydroxychromene-2-carboxylate isomerase
MPNALIPYIARAIFSTRLLKLKRAVAEHKRKFAKQPHTVAVYLALNDPYSYLLLQVLKDFQDRFSIQYEFRTVLNKQEEMFPAPKLWKKNAFNDAVYLAGLYSLDFPSVLPPVLLKSSPERDSQLTAQLLHWELQPGYLENALQLFNAYWQGDDSVIDGLVSPAITHNVECYQQHLNANESLLKDNGHYLSAMMHYGNEWYWGLDRLQYLERRFNDLAAHSDADSKNLGSAGVEVKYDATHRHFCQRMNKQDIPEVAEKHTLEMFWSIRSPYSYIAIVRARQLANYYNIPLIVKPVLPMVMRRMQVPKNKTNYIAKDASREAHQYKIPFGRIADPLGKGVENCYALYAFAQSKGKATEFLESYARGVWSEGIHSDTASGLKKLVERVGLSWQEAQPLLNNNDWRVWAQSNLAELYGNNLWGVPSLIYGDVKVFGQDRIDCIEQAIVKTLNLAKPLNIEKSK